jgi:predicted RNase H-like HicB family nuclease
VYYKITTSAIFEISSTIKTFKYNDMSRGITYHPLFRRGQPMNNYFFKVIIEEDVHPDGTPGYHAYCPALKSCYTCAHTYEEAVANIKEAVEVYVESLIAYGEPVPAGAIEEETIDHPLP